jgi:hypothetical protein
MRQSLENLKRVFIWNLKYPQYSSQLRGYLFCSSLKWIFKVGHWFVISLFMISQVPHFHQLTGQLFNLSLYFLYHLFLNVSFSKGNLITLFYTSTSCFMISWKKNTKRTRKISWKKYKKNFKKIKKNFKFLDNIWQNQREEKKRKILFILENIGNNILWKFKISKILK